MKKLYILPIFASVLLTSACVSEKSDFSPVGDGTTLISASIESDQTKAAWTGYSSVVWTEGDEVSVNTTSDTFADFVLSDGEGTTTGTFTGTVGVATLASPAVYPSALSPVYAEGDLTVTLPATYKYSEYGIDAPMVSAVAEDGSLAFKHICGVVKFDVTNIPAYAEKFVFTATKENVSGEVTIENLVPGTSAAAVTEGENNTITITFTAGSMKSASFLIPLPVGTYASGYKVGLQTSDGTVIEGTEKVSTKDLVVERADLKIMSAYACEAASSKTLWDAEDDYVLTWSTPLNVTTSELKVGDKLRVHLKSNGGNEWPQIYLTDPDPWTKLTESLAVSDKSGADTYVDIEITSEYLENLTTSFVIEGDGVDVLSIELLPGIETGVITTTVWKGETVIANWDKAVTTSLPILKAGDKIKVNLETSTDETYTYHVISFADASWNKLYFEGLSQAEDNETIVVSKGATSIIVELTEEMTTALAGGLVIQGYGLTIKEVQLMSYGNTSYETTIWTGNAVSSGWSYMNDLIDFPWEDLKVGTVIRFYYTPDEGVTYLNLGLGKVSDWSGINVSNPATGSILMDMVMTEDLLNTVAAEQGATIIYQNLTLTKITIR